MPIQAPQNHVFGEFWPQTFFYYWDPQKALGYLTRKHAFWAINVRDRSSSVTCRREQEYKKDKVTENSHPTQTPFPSSHINQILHAGSYRGYLSWFWVSLKLVKNVGAVEGRNFGIPIDLAHCLYNSLLLSHKPWWILIRQSRQQTINRWQLTAISRPKSYFFSRVRDMEHSTPPWFFFGGGDLEPPLILTFGPHSRETLGLLVIRSSSSTKFCHEKLESLWHVVLKISYF